MVKRILIDAVHPEETRVVIQENNRVEEFDYESSAKKQIKGNIYLAKVTRVEPSLQAAFVDYGSDKHGFLPFSEIHPDYYQIPSSDKEKLIAEEQGLVHDEDDEIIDEILSEHGLDDFIPDDEEFKIDSDLDSDDEAESSPKRKPRTSKREDRTPAHRRYKIQEVIKRGQLVQVQVIKEERGNKGASLTSYISLAGRYCVLMPKSLRQGGVSRRIENVEDRKRLKAILDSIDTGNHGLIVRTAGTGRTQNEIKRDFDYLQRLWENICTATVSSTAPAFIHTEGDIIRRFIRDHYDEDINEVLIEGDDAYETAKDFIQMIQPANASRVKRYRQKVPIFTRYNVDEQINKLYSPEAALPSGGYLVINPTEALISIDVNSGKATTGRDVEETALKTNLEAAQEVARQLRLRDLSGLVVVDFIDMMENGNRRAVERTLRDALQNDRAKTQIGRISPFGLLEMSRQRLRSSFIESNTVQCPHCAGTGAMRTPESIAVMILRSIEQTLLGRINCKEINAFASHDAVIYILNYKRDDIVSIEARYNVRILLHPDAEIQADDFRLEKNKHLSEGVKEPQPALQAANDYGSDEDYIEEDEAEEAAVTGASADNPRPPRRNNRRGGNNNRRRHDNSRRPEPYSQPVKKEGSLLKGLWKRIVE